MYHITPVNLSHRFNYFHDDITGLNEIFRIHITCSASVFVLCYCYYAVKCSMLTIKMPILNRAQRTFIFVERQICR